jgi:rhodanese-related sulfurtransferase
VRRQAATLVDVLVFAALSAMGWSAQLQPAAPVRFKRGDETVEPEGQVAALLNGTAAARSAWADFCIATGLADFDLKLRKNPACKVCGEAPTITHLIDYEAFCGVPARDDHQDAVTPWDIPPKQLVELLMGNEPPILVDVREPVEQQISNLPGAINLPLGTLSQRLKELDSAREYVLFCRTGVRSAQGLQILLGSGFSRVHHLQGGINAWAQQVDPGMLQY